MMDSEGGSIKWANFIFNSISRAFADFSNGFWRASIKISIELEIYGFFIVSPIRLNAYAALSLMVGCALLKQLESVGTITGNEVWSCLAEQLAIIPNIQIYDILILQFC